MRTLLFVLLMLVFGCKSHEDVEVRLSDVPVKIPNELIRFDAIGNTPLSHIGYSTIVLENGDILIPDRQHLKLFKVDSSGELIEAIGRDGRGPGEFQDISFLSKSAFGNTLVYDQMNRKVVELDNSGHYNTEFLLPPETPPGSLVELYELSEQLYLMIFQSFEYLFNENADQLTYLVVFDKEQESVLKEKTIVSRPYAIRTGGSGGRMVPYAAADLYAYDKSTADFYLYRSNEHDISKLDTSLDTLQVIAFDLQPEILTKAESDSIGIEIPEYWDAMQKLLPEYKALAHQMMIDHRRNIWLRLNHTSDYQQWLAISDQGELMQVIQLPKGSMLTHISEEHLGVRLDDVTFALYEYPESL